MSKKNMSYYIGGAGLKDSAVLAIIGFETETESVLLYNLVEHTLQLASLSELTAVVMEDTLQNIFNNMKAQQECSQNFSDKLKAIQGKGDGKANH